MLDNQGSRHIFIICNTYSFFCGNSGYANAPKCYVSRTLALLFFYAMLTRVNATRFVRLYKYKILSYWFAGGTVENTERRVQPRVCVLTACALNL